ncbi:MAG: YfiR family protein [Planctomycetes bacterium]|nr:YfiR family protein [Planctomycetota bacterium]
MRELSTPAKSMLMAAATMMIGFFTLAACQGNDKMHSRMAARGDISLAYKALNYIGWPGQSFEARNSPVVLVVLGQASAAHEKVLAPYVLGQKIRCRTVHVQRVAKPDDIPQCQILVVTESCSPGDTTQALKVVQKKGVLTIGETAEFTKSGGVLSVVKSGDEAFLELNQQAAKRQGLKMDVRLINLSVLVEEG